MPTYLNIIIDFADMSMTKWTLRGDLSLPLKDYSIAEVLGVFTYTIAIF